MDRDRDGFFRCPNRCGNPDYPQPKWKTEEGFAGHMAKCKAKPEPELVWVPEPKAAREKFGECPDCGSILWKMSSCWWMHGRIVCVACYRPYFEAGIGHHDACGLTLPGLTLEG